MTDRNVREYSSESFRRLVRLAPPRLPRPERAENLCEALRGCPYLINPLGGGPGQEESFTVSLDAFDCVTLMETVTALSTTRSERSFLERMRVLRYRGGRVTYLDRRHYLSDWFTENTAAGRLILPAIDEPPRIFTRELTALPALGPRTADVTGWPKGRLSRLRRNIRSGDLIGFISTRPHLDYFHTGILLSRAAHILLTHASRNRDMVIIEPLEHFLKANRMSGFSILRPTEPPETTP